MSADDGIKELTLDNWLEFDPAFAVATSLRSTGDARWTQFATEVLRERLDPDVPPEVARLVQAGRAAVLYGCFYYPLLAIGIDHVVRAIEAAAHARCEREGQLPKRPKFQDLIDRLVSSGLITKKRGQDIHALREMRNASAHPREQARMPPGMVLPLLRAAVDDINAIFGATASDLPPAPGTMDGAARPID